MELKLQTLLPIALGTFPVPHIHVWVTVRGGGHRCGSEWPLMAADSLSDNPSKALPAWPWEPVLCDRLSFLFHPSVSCYLAAIWDPMTWLLPFDPLLTPGPGSPVSNQCWAFSPRCFMWPWGGGCGQGPLCPALWQLIFCQVAGGAGGDGGRMKMKTR